MLFFRRATARRNTAAFIFADALTRANDWPLAVSHNVAATASAAATGAHRLRDANRLAFAQLAARRQAIQSRDLFDRHSVTPGQRRHRVATADLIGRNLHAIS